MPCHPNLWTFLPAAEHVYKSFFSFSSSSSFIFNLQIFLLMTRLCVSRGRQISREVKFPGKLNFPGSQISGKSNFPGSCIFREVKFSGKSNFPGSEISREVEFPGKSNFREVGFSGKSDFPGSQVSREIKFPGSQISGKSNFREAAKWLV